MTMEKYGFVYLWYDKKHKRFYIGCHWGTEDDRYISSSSWMKQGYKHRPNDFKRRILSRVYTNKQDLLEEEYRWLSKITENELGKRYYNLHNHHFNHWSTDENKKLTVGQKVSRSKTGKKGTPHTEESKQKLREARAKQIIPSWKHTEETKQKMRKPKPPRTEEHKKNMSEAKKGSIPWNKGKILKPDSQKYSTIYMRSYQK